MTHDNTYAVMSKFKSTGATRIFDTAQPIFTLDHNVQDKSKANLAKYDAIRSFAEDHDLTAFPAGRGIGHQVLVEEGLVLPGKMVVASDSHSNMYVLRCPFSTIFGDISL
jgi:homoaconitate hydratase